MSTWWYSVSGYQLGAFLDDLKQSRDNRMWHVASEGNNRQKVMNSSAPSEHHRYVNIDYESVPRIAVVVIVYYIKFNYWKFISWLSCYTGCYSMTTNFHFPDMKRWPDNWSTLSWCLKNEMSLLSASSQETTRTLRMTVKDIQRSPTMLSAFSISGWISSSPGALPQWRNILNYFWYWCEFPGSLTNLILVTGPHVDKTEDMPRVLFVASCLFCFKLLALRDRLKWAMAKSQWCQLIFIVPDIYIDISEERYPCGTKRSPLLL